MISNQCTYALKAMLELAKRYGEGPVPIQVVASSQEIPARFLEAILRHLKQGGLTDSIRGKSGGYILAKPPEMISFGEVVQLIEGPLVQPRAAQGDGKIAEPLFDPIWNEAEETLTRLMKSISLQDLVERDSLLVRSSAQEYFI